ncbi:helix-turn-helix domain-containing protein [Paraburkholderia sp. BL21I4N1]|uniref:helix-turn-helix domain-containing protein n=1 Tax=Paraburkholderia sp. BL21I4N1 TaxID=1938801 RepID=UPI000CFBF722|nr:helix-turn-helix domain-containing protein [Paraburkholderia sp. BL21I4N1]PQV48576.1 AraC family transcriptional regulator [Paraburkholderia sp. BL21I4N1]
MPKPLKFDSSLLKPKDGEEIWRGALAPIYEIQRAGEFRAKIETWDLGGSMLLTSHSAKDEVQFQRTRRRIATSGVDHYLVHCLLGGELVSEFASGQQNVPLRSVAVRDMAVENIGFARDAPMLTLSIPRAALDRRMPEGSRLHGASFDARDPIGALVSSHICALAQTLTAMTEDESRTAADATLGLLAACLLPKVERAASRDDPRLAPMLRAQAMSLIERRLGESDFDAEALRRELKMSRTALYGLFAENGGVARQIRARRLDEAMRRLADPRHARQRIAEIAFAVGFSSEPTFNRAFRERFGCSPGEARADVDARSAKPAAAQQPAGQPTNEIAAKYQAAIRGVSG